MIRGGHSEGSLMSARRFARFFAFVCIIVAFLWFIGFASGGPVVIHFGGRCHVGFNGLSIRIVTTRLPAEQSALMNWDVVDSSFNWESGWDVGRLGIPVLPIFAAAAITAIVLWIVVQRRKPANPVE